MTTPRRDEFSSIWTLAVAQYEKNSGIGLKKTAQSHSAITSLNNLFNVVDIEQHAFSDYRDKGARVRKVLSVSMQ